MGRQGRQARHPRNEARHRPIGVYKIIRLKNYILSYVFMYLKNDMSKFTYKNFFLNPLFVFPILQKKINIFKVNYTTRPFVHAPGILSNSFADFDALDISFV